MTDSGLAPDCMGMSVPQDLSKLPTMMPKDGEVEADEEGAEVEGGKEKKRPTREDALGDQARLKAWFSS